MTVVAPAPAVVPTRTVLLRRFDAWLARPVSVRSLALLRVLVGPIALIHLEPFLRAAADGTIYRDHFHEAYVGWYPDLPRHLYVAALWLGAATAVAMTFGVATRLATTTCWAVITYNVFLSTTHVHNNRLYLVIVLTALAVVPCGRELSVDAWWRRRTGRVGEPATSVAWPLWLLRFEAATVYGASGLSKLLDRDWFAGTVTWHRVVRVRHRLEASVLPDWAVDLLADRSFHTFAAKGIVLTELFIALCLWWHRTRLIAVWVAVCFHIAIQLSAEVQVFSYLAVAVLVIWSVPATRDRTLLFDPSRAGHRLIAASARRLDWLARFRVVAATERAHITVVDRDGRVFAGAHAVAVFASRLPVTAWFALPIAGVLSVRQRLHLRRATFIVNARTGRQSSGV